MDAQRRVEPRRDKTGGDHEDVAIGMHDAFRAEEPTRPTGLQHDQSWRHDKRSAAANSSEIGADPKALLRVLGRVGATSGHRLECRKGLMGERDARPSMARFAGIHAGERPPHATTPLHHKQEKGSGGCARSGSRAKDVIDPFPRKNP